MKAKKSITNSGCPEALSSNCVVWTGDNIPCLDISYGDRISEVVCAIANKICNICKDIDMSQLDLSCLIDICEGCPEDRSVKTILQLLLDNQCKLHDLITGSSDDGTCCTIAVNMKCLKKFDDFGNEIPQDLNAALQSIVNETCTHRTTLITLQNEIDDLQDQIDNLPDPTPYVEPDITTCITPDPTPTSEAVPIIAQDYCDYKALVGNEASISTAISRQCAGLNTDFGLIDGWILSPTTLAASFNNLWIAYCSALERLKFIEDTCCKIDCDSIDIHFQVDDNQDSDGASIHFSGLFGNKVPSVFIDCGSSITFTDHTDAKVTYTIIIAQESTSPEYDLSMLDLSEKITISINAKLCSDSMTCVKCITAEHIVLNGACEACDITITGTSGSVIILYTINGHTDSVTGSVGDVVYISKNAINVSYVTVTGDAVPDTSCLVIEEADYNCYLFSWEIGAPDQVPLDDAIFTQVNLGTTNWTISSPYTVYETLLNVSGRDMFTTVNNIGTPLIIASCYLDSDINSYLFVKVVGTDIPKIRITNPTGEGTDFMYIYGVLQDSCDCPDGFNTELPA